MLAEIQVSLDTFGGPKVIFVGRYDPGGSPHNGIINFAHHGENH
jgi:hypothetical protein